MHLSRLILIVAISVPNASLSADMCQILSGLFVETERPAPQDDSSYSVEAFQSAKLDACIHVERNNGTVTVFDLTRSEMPDPQSDWGIILLNCGPDGVVPATIRKVSDGQVQPDCDSLLDQWLTDWR